MSEAWFGFLGVIVGAAVSLLGEQFTTRREREARQALRDQERKDRRDDFQRETILALQDAFAQLASAAARERESMFAEHAASGRWPAKEDWEPLPEMMEPNWAIGRLQARILDAELRDLARRNRDAVFAMVLAQDLRSMEQRTREATKAIDLLNQRVTVLLSDLF